MFLIFFEYFRKVRSEILKFKFNSTQLNSKEPSISRTVTNWTRRTTCWSDIAVRRTKKQEDWSWRRKNRKIRLGFPLSPLPSIPQKRTKNWRSKRSNRLIYYQSTSNPNPDSGIRESESSFLTLKREEKPASKWWPTAARRAPNTSCACSTSFSSWVSILSWDLLSLKVNESRRSEIRRGQQLLWVRKGKLSSLLFDWVYISLSFWKVESSIPFYSLRWSCIRGRAVAMDVSKLGIVK